LGAKNPGTAIGLGWRPQPYSGTRLCPGYGLLTISDGKPNELRASIRMRNFHRLAGINDTISELS